jgi:phosphinothricin acetyltransferase
MIIRPANTGDTAAILTIWNHYIANTIATFNSELKTLDGVKTLMASQPFWVVDNGGAVGFATYGDFRKGVGYARTAEHTLFLTDGLRGQGRALMAPLENHARRAGIHSLFAGVCHENTNAVGFHQAIGYKHAATLPQVGWKFGRWHDLILMQKFL